MFFLPEIRRHPSFREGWRAMAGISAGLGAWGLMTGVAMLKAGLSVGESVAMTLLVFAGSSQLAATPLLVAGAPVWVILATSFCVNLRFVVFSLHLRGYLIHLPRWRRILHGYFTADLSYVVFVRRYPSPSDDPAQRAAQEAYLAGGCFINWCTWIGMSLVGVALANFVPVHWGLGFAGVLCLVAVTCSMTSTRLRLLAALIAGATAVAAFALPLRMNIVLAIGVASLLCVWLERQLGLDASEQDRI